MKKALIILISRNTPMPECYNSIANQQYSNYSFMTYVRRMELGHPDPYKNLYINAAMSREEARDLALASDADYFLFVDDDVVLPPHALAQLLSSGKDIVGGWYKMHNRPEWTAVSCKESKLNHYISVPPGLTEVSMLGLGCCLVSREALLFLHFKPGISETVRIGNTDYLLGDCFSFCRDAQKRGYKTYLDGSVVCQHLPRIPVPNMEELDGADNNSDQRCDSGPNAK